MRERLLNAPHADEVSISKQLIMEAAARLFADKGYGGVGISEVGEVAGFGKGALYYHIRSKEDLLFDIMTIYMVELIDAAHAVERDVKKNIPAKIRALSRSFMDIMFASRPEMTVCFREVHALTEHRRRDVLKLHAEYQDVWLRIFSEGARQGVLRPLSKIEVKALLGMYFYSFLWIRGDGAMTVRAIAESFASLVLNASTTKSIKAKKPKTAKSKK